MKKKIAFFRCASIYNKHTTHRERFKNPSHRKFPPDIHIPKICPKYPKDMPIAQDIPKICPRCPQYAHRPKP